MKASLLLACALGLTSVVKSHTVAWCYVANGGSVTFYAGTYHGLSEINSQGGNSGGLLLDGVRYGYDGLVIDSGESPSGVAVDSCSRCATYTGNGIQYWQTVTVNGLASGTYTVTSTSEHQIEWPWCTGNTITVVADTPDPTEYPTEPPTVAPTWVAPCANNPCQCDSSVAGFEDPDCIICHANGCDQCDGTNGEYFKLDYNYPCKLCTDVFGAECLHCQDFDGCGECDTGYARVYDSSEDLYYCEELPPVPAPTMRPTRSPSDPPATTCTDGITQCASSNCAGAGENPQCGSQQTWGCPSCNAGYFQKSHQFPCTVCNHIAGCISCSDYQGCTACAGGYSWYWDVQCNIGRCQ